MGKNQIRLLRFAIAYPGWHSCGPDSRATMRNLHALGLLEVTANGEGGPQFRIALPSWAHNGIDAARLVLIA